MMIRHSVNATEWCDMSYCDISQTTLPRHPRPRDSMVLSSTMVGMFDLQTALVHDCIQHLDMR